MSLHSSSSSSNRSTTPSTRAAAPAAARREEAAPERAAAVERVARIAQTELAAARAAEAAHQAQAKAREAAAVATALRAEADAGEQTDEGEQADADAQDAGLRGTRNHGGGTATASTCAAQAASTRMLAQGPHEWAPRADATWANQAGSTRRPGSTTRLRRMQDRGADAASTTSPDADATPSASHCGTRALSGRWRPNGTTTRSRADRTLARGALAGSAPPLPRTGTEVAVVGPALLPSCRPSSRTPAADGPCSPRPTTPSGPW
jgi:hypothetical protein